MGISVGSCQLYAARCGSRGGGPQNWRGHNLAAATILPPPKASLGVPYPPTTYLHGKHLVVVLSGQHSLWYRWISTYSLPDLSGSAARRLIVIRRTRRTGSVASSCSPCPTSTAWRLSGVPQGLSAQVQPCPCPLSWLLSSSAPRNPPS